MRIKTVQKIALLPEDRLAVSMCQWPVLGSETDEASELIYSTRCLVLRARAGAALQDTGPVQTL